jgi:hypothetical protein
MDQQHQLKSVKFRINNPFSKPLHKISQPSAQESVTQVRRPEHLPKGTIQVLAIGRADSPLANISALIPISPEDRSGRRNQNARLIAA